MRRTTTATTMRQQTTEHCPYLKTTGCLHEISSTFARIDRLCSGTAVRADNLSWLLDMEPFGLTQSMFFFPFHRCCVGEFQPLSEIRLARRCAFACRFSSQ